MFDRNIKFLGILIVCLLNKFKYIYIDANILLILIMLTIITTLLPITEHMSIDYEALQTISSMYDSNSDTLKLFNIKVKENITAEGHVEGKNIKANEDISIGLDDKKWIIKNKKDNIQRNMLTIGPYSNQNDDSNSFIIRDNHKIGLHGGKWTIGRYNTVAGIAFNNNLMQTISNKMGGIVWSEPIQNPHLFY